MAEFWRLEKEWEMYLNPVSWTGRQLLHFLQQFMEKNRAFYGKDSKKRIADNALVAITLMIAESNPVEKETPG